ncbi:MAG: alpha/beta hydrolase [Glaciihabitans sp.]|nr:alpha/beta hydrolase [Glaciihabitans sp.]
MTEFTHTSLGDRVAYDRYGIGPALIFVAGAGQFRGSDPLTSVTAESAARQGLTTIVYDRLGRGESVADGALTLEREIAAIAALIEVAGGHAVLCGNSSGCSIALAATHAGLPVAGLALWEAPLGPENGGAAEWSAEVSRRLDEGDLEGAQVYYMKDMPPEWLEGARHSPMWPQLVAQAPSVRADAQSLAWAESGPHSSLFADITVPVEVLIGEQTQPIMESAAESITAAIPGSTLRRMPGANHSWEAEPMAAELTAFVMIVG